MDRVARQALEAHRRLDQEIDRLKAAVKLEGREPPADWFRQTSQHFRRFHTDLRNHIDMEETDGFLVPVRQRRPTLTPQVEALRREHQAMIETCVEIEQFLAGHAQPTEQDVHEAHARIDRLLSTLDEHEALENQLVQQVFSQDIGAGD